MRRLRDTCRNGPHRQPGTNRNLKVRTRAQIRLLFSTHHSAFSISRPRPKAHRRAPFRRCLAAHHSASPAATAEVNDSKFGPVHFAFVPSCLCTSNQSRSNISLTHKVRSLFPFSSQFSPNFFQESANPLRGPNLTPRSLACRSAITSDPVLHSLVLASRPPPQE